MMHLPRRHYAAVIIAAIILLVAVVAVIPAAAFVFTTPFTPLALFDVSNNYRYSHNLLSKRGGALNSNRRDNDSFIRETAATSIEEESEEEGIRLNKVFKATHSRRAADKLIEEGRVTVNGQRVHERGGYKVVPFRDVVALDGKVVKGWEQINAIARDNADVLHQKRALERNNKEQQRQPSNNLQTSSFEYVKYYKPIGITCTTDLRVKDNIIDAINNDGYKARHRVYPVGRLDKETSGLIILTSDGRIVNAVLRGERKQPKVYKVKVDGVLEDRHLQRLRVCQ
jgi:16S rRNA U516 pseudouridylate synthase RsuA-like enzyme